MVERIDFALEPGVIVFTVFCFLLINVLLGIVLYPYLKEGAEVDSTAEEEMEEEPYFIEEASPASEETMEDRIEKFHRDISESSSSGG